MGQSSKYAVVVKVAQIKSSREECALSMGQSANYVAVMGVQIKLKREECA